MDSVAFFESVLTAVNNARVEKGVGDLLDSSAVEQLFQHAVFRYTINLTYTGDDDVEEDAVKQHLIAKVTLAVSAEPVDGELEDPRIHLLDKIEYAADHHEVFTEIANVGPWQMMFTPSVEGDGSHTFAIPVTIKPEHRSGTIKVLVYVDEITSIPYSDEPESYDYYSSSNICSLEYTVRAASDVEVGVGSLNGNLGALNFGEQGVDESRGGHEVHGSRRMKTPPRLVVKAVKIAVDYDELQQLRAEGYDLSCVHLTAAGAVEEQEHMWKFHILALYGPPHEGGVEDIIFVSAPKGEQAALELEDYIVHGDTDLSGPDDEASVFIATRSGPSPQFSKLTMLSYAVESEAELEPFVHAQNGIFREAPGPISRAMGFPVGLLLESKLSTVGVETEEDMGSASASAAGGERGGVTGSVAGSKKSQKSQKSRGSKASLGGGLEDNEEEDEVRSEGELSHMTNEDELNPEDSMLDEEEVVRSLKERFDALDFERQELDATNAEMQKKCSALIIKEKNIQIANSATKTAAVEPMALDAEQLQEKEKQFVDTLELVTDARAKFVKQQAEFDQLALDLQTRLDDKEFKAGEISKSFKDFKREILTKAVNSRTGKNLSKRLIEQFEAIELKRDEDLEKVRLKNISLRSNLRKLERALRSKEQLAEGLHMIDFEQLKIENQTLNEKIEERNEELSKLKRKKTVTVQVLTHVREKLRFVEKSNKVIHADLDGIETQNLELRAQLATVKKDRDAVKLDNKELKRRQGFATSDLLLVDFETRKSSLEAMKAEIRELQDRYRILARQAGVATAAFTGTRTKQGIADGGDGGMKLPSIVGGGGRR